MWLANLFLTGVCISNSENGYTSVEQISKPIVDKESLCSHIQRSYKQGEGPNALCGVGLDSEVSAQIVCFYGIIHITFTVFYHF